MRAFELDNSALLKLTTGLAMTADERKTDKLRIIFFTAFPFLKLGYYWSAGVIVHVLPPQVSSSSEALPWLTTSTCFV
jgi:hypothetical protein